MHGRLKVRTDAEKAAAEQRKNEEKAAKFREGINAAFEMVSQCTLVSLFLFFFSW